MGGLGWVMRLAPRSLGVKFRLMASDPPNQYPEVLIASADDRPSLASAAEIVASELPAAQRYLDIADVMIVAIGLDETVTLANRKAADVIGCPASEIVGKNWFEQFIPREHRQPLRGLFQQLIRGDVELTARAEGSIRCWNGRNRQIAWRNTVLRDPVGNVVGTLSSGEDVSAQRLAERRLRESNEHLRLALRAARLGTWTWDVHTGDFELDQGWAQMLGRDARDLEPHISTWESLIHPHDKQLVTKALDDCLQERLSLFQVECRMRSVPDEWRWVRVTGSIAARDSQGRPSRMSGVQADAHERIVAERALHEREALLSRAERIAHVGSWEWDLAQNQMRWSEELRNILGLEAEITPSRASLLDRTHPSNRDELSKAMDAATVGADRGFSLEHVVVQPGGAERVVQHTAETVSDQDGRALRVMGTLQDITVRRRIEAEVRELNEELERRVRDRTAELEAANHELEAFAYSVSHDLRAPLRAIDGFGQALEEDFGTELTSDARTYLARIRSGAHRMGALIDDLLALSRLTRVPMRRQQVYLGAIAVEVAADLRSAEPDRDVEVRIGDDLETQGDPTLLQAVMQNLISNAWKFTRGRQPGCIEVNRNTAGDETVFYVRDNGAGFDMKYADKLFGAFQRLHSPREFEGTGIGLATVQRIVRRHGGRVWAEGVEGKGATFYFTLGR